MDRAASAWVDGRPHDALNILAAAGLNEAGQVAAVRGMVRGARKRYERVMSAYLT